MPGTFNPVSGNPVFGNPVAGVTNPKSFRTRLGFGGSSGGVPSLKPSFFSQLNLKPGRKSVGGPTDVRVHDQSILVIDLESENGKTRQENHVVLNDEQHSNRSQINSTKSHCGNPPNQSPPLPRNTLHHSLPVGTPGTSILPYSLNSRMDFDISSVKGTTPEKEVNADESGLSKHLPDLSTDLSLLINEQPPSDTMSQSDHHHNSQASVSIGKGRSQKNPPHRDYSLHSSPKVFENHDRTQRSGQELARTDHKLHHVVSSPLTFSRGSPDWTATVSSSTNIGAEDESASFDLSSARLSLDLVRQNLGEDWDKGVIVESNSTPGADLSSLLAPPDRSVAASSSGPVTSTPFRSPSASPHQSQRGEADMSFNLDALDPDLVALLRPNNYNEGSSQIKRMVTPPLASSPDPLNPVTITQLKQPTTTAAPPVSPTASRMPPRLERLTPSPVRKFATTTSSASTSPIRQLRLPRSYTVQDIFPPESKPTPLLSTAHNELNWLETCGRDDGRPSPSVVTFSDTGTASDVSKQPSPLSAPPLTLNDLQPKPRRSPVQSSTASSSTSNIAPRYQSRSPVPTQTHSPDPISVLTSSTHSRGSPQYAPYRRDRESRPASASPEVQGSYLRTFGSVGRERERIRPQIRGAFPAQSSLDGDIGRPNSTDPGRPAGMFRPRVNSNTALPHPWERDWESSIQRRYRKRSMSLDQSAGPLDKEGRFHHGVTTNSRSQRSGDREQRVEPVGYSTSEYTQSMAGSLGTPYDNRDSDRDQERYGYGYGYVDRERSGRPNTDWLGPRTMKAFAAAGLLDDPRDVGPRHGFTRSTSDRDFRTPGLGSSRERRSPISTGFSLMDGERDREPFRYNYSRDREHRSSRSGAVSPSTTSGTRPPSRGDSRARSRPAPLFARTMSDLMSHRGSTDGRDSMSGVHPRTGSAYSGGGGGTGGGSTGSGGGRASPTTTSSLIAVQSQIQSIKEKHDAQTEALLAALADSQRTTKELREENEALKSQVRSLEERLVETIADSRQREKELSRTLRAKPICSPDRTHTAGSYRDREFSIQSRPVLTSKPPTRLAPSPTKRRLSTSSSVFPAIPGSMSLLMAETPGSPPQGSLDSGSSPPSPTLVLPRLVTKQKSPECRDTNGYKDAWPSSGPQRIPMSHRRSTSGASEATSANFSFGTGSPGSLKLRPEHELLLGDMTRLSLATGFGGDSESEN